MATWHQQRNPEGLRSLWQQHPTQWKCISDRPNECAGSISFNDEAEARAYAAKTGDRVLPPAGSAA
jgi:hypothetical protein